MNGYIFEVLPKEKRLSFSSFDKRQALKWINDVLKNYQKPLEELEKVEVIKYCIQNEFSVPSDLTPYMSELVRDELANWAGNINHSSVPLYAISAIDDAHFYTKLYYTYAT